MTTREEIVAEARSWINTPYRHQGRTKGVGVDCIGVSIGLGRKFGMCAEDFDYQGYAREPDGSALMREICKYMVRRKIGPDELKPGMMLVVSFGGAPQHFAITAPYPVDPSRLSIVHAYANIDRPRVVETRLMWHSRFCFVAAFDFPGVEF